MTKEEATLVAAGIAFLASIINIVVSLYSSRRNELRTSHRNALQPYLSGLGEGLHETVAVSAMLLKFEGSDTLANWRNKAKSAQEKLESSRKGVRYILWGIDEGINLLRKLPDWMDHARAFKSNGEQILYEARNLQERLDEIIRDSYKNGEPPSKKSIKKLNESVEKYKLAIERFRIESSESK